MDTIALVEGQVDDGQRLLDRLGDEAFPVAAACWVKPADEDRWSLYIATPSVDDDGALSAYGRLNRVLQTLGDCWVSDSDVKLIGERHPIARDLLKRASRRGSARAGRGMLGNLPVQDSYRYPQGKVNVKIYGMWFQGNPEGGLQFSFEPLKAGVRLTIEDRLEFVSETGLLSTVAAPEGSALERDASGRLQLAWDFHGVRTKSDAQDVWSFAKLGLQGFRFVGEPAVSTNGRPS